MADILQCRAMGQLQLTVMGTEVFGDLSEMTQLTELRIERVEGAVEMGDLLSSVT